MDDETTTVVIPGAEFNAADHGHDMASILQVGAMFGVLLPWVTSGDRCLDVHPDGWTCTRVDNHKGRHHATFPNGDLGYMVLAVWHQRDW